MIIRENDKVSESEHMVISDGFVLCPNSYPFEFKNSPLKDVQFPTFAIFKVNEGHPLVVHNSQGNSYIIPKQDFDALRSDDLDGPKIRMPADWMKDKLGYDLAMLALAPYDVDSKDLDSRGFEKVDFLKGQNGFLGASLLYGKRGFVRTDVFQRTSHVMPSSLPHYIYNWIFSPRRVKLSTRTEFLNLPPEGSRDLTQKAVKILEDRFEMSLNLRDLL